MLTWRHSSCRGALGAAPSPRITRFMARISCCWCRLLLICTGHATLRLLVVPKKQSNRVT